MVRFLASIVLGYAVLTAVALDTSLSKPVSYEQNTRKSATGEETSTISHARNITNSTTGERTDFTKILTAFTNSNPSIKSNAIRALNEPISLQTGSNRIDFLNKIASSQKVASLLHKKYAIQELSNEEDQQSLRKNNNYPSGKKANIPAFIPRSSFSLPGIHGTLPKYIKEGAAVIPPFPEMYHGSSNRDMTGILLKKNIFDADSSISNAEAVSNISEDKQKTFEKEILRSSQPKQFLNPKEESIFQPLSSKSYDSLHPVPAFPELHAAAQYQRSETSQKKEDNPTFILDESRIPQRAGHELYPSSVFQKELRVPFF